MSSTSQLINGRALAVLLALAPCAHAGAAEADTAAAPAGAARSAPQAGEPRAGEPRAEAPAGAAPGALVAASVPGFGRPAAAAQLDSARGGSDAMSASAALQGAVTGNNATNVVTGGNTIQSGAFSGASGIPIVIQNSGANVLIQNATVINLQFRE